MPTIGDDLDWVQGILGDASTIGTDGALWPRQDLLNLYNDALGQLLAESQAVRRLTILDVPGRFTYTMTADWEAAYTQGGTFWKWTYSAPGYECSSLWEVDFLEGITPENSSEGITQEWERAFINPAQQYYRFALPRNNERIAAMWYDHRRLAVLETRDLDQLWQNWMSLGDYPLAWMVGTGRNRTFEIYEIVTDYSQGYSVRANLGIPRYFSGARTWVTESSQLYGIARRVISPDRQYLVQGLQTGTPRQWHSSDLSLMIWEVIGPEIPDLQEDETPLMIPTQCQKYLRFAVLAGAWKQQGPGYQPQLAALCETLFKRGVGLLTLLGDLTRKDMDWQREPAGGQGRFRPPRVQLPANYPRVYR